jgi:methionyl aminopeptidase
MSKFVKSKSEIELIAEGGKILADILQKVASHAAPSVSTLELSNLADELIRKAGGVPSFIGYGPKYHTFKHALCTSINDVVVHGVPSTLDVLESGDIVGLDIGMKYKGFFTDTALTVLIGDVDEGAKKLVEATKGTLDAAMAVVKAGVRTGDIGAATEAYAKSMGFSVVKDLGGHGVGYEVHEDPFIPCFGKAGTGEVLPEGSVICIEPMLCEGKPGLYIEEDNWTIRTRDGGWSAHFEHTLEVTKDGFRVLT